MAAGVFHDAVPAHGRQTVQAPPRLRGRCRADVAASESEASTACWEVTCAAMLGLACTSSGTYSMELRMENLKYTGGCVCGWVRYQALGPVQPPHACSCRTCQQHTGAPVAVWVEYPAASVSWVGPGGAPATFRSSSGSSRAFCPRCGSSIGAIDDAPTIALLTGGFDDPRQQALRPLYHSFEDGKPAWCQVGVPGSGA